MAELPRWKYGTMRNRDGSRSDHTVYDLRPLRRLKGEPAERWGTAIAYVTARSSGVALGGGRHTGRWWAEGSLRGPRMLTQQGFSTRPVRAGVGDPFGVVRAKMIEAARLAGFAILEIRPEPHGEAPPPMLWTLPVSVNGAEPETLAEFFRRRPLTEYSQAQIAERIEAGGTFRAPGLRFAPVGAEGFFPWSRKVNA